MVTRSGKNITEVVETIGLFVVYKYRMGYAVVGQSNTGGSTGMDILLVKTDDTGNADPSQ